mgnify:FL=1
MPLLIGIIALLVIGGGIYVYQIKKVETPVSSASTEVQNDSSVTTATNNQQNQVNQKVTLDMSPVFNQNYKTVLTQAFSEPADFNGHYVVASIGCGSGCFTYAIVDKNTGKVYQVPKINDVGVYRGDIGQPYSLSSNQIKLITDNGSKIETYSFNDTNFTLVSSVVVSSQPSITILSPKKGEFWKMGQTYTISYSVNGNFGPITIKLNRYADDGTLIQSIDVGTSETNTFVYRVPTTLEDTKGSAGMFKIEVYPATGRELVKRSEYFSIIR